MVRFKEGLMSVGRTATDLTRELLHFDTINPPGQERACAEYLGKLLEESGFRIDFYEFDRDRTSLIARLPGSGAQPPLCFSGHIDTVPLGQAPWTVDPFVGDIEGGKLYGRGSSDMKSGVAAFVTAAIGIASRSEPTAGLVLAITAGEENGCEGAYDLVSREGVLGHAGAFVVAEPTSNLPVVGHKGALWLEARTEGVTAHGSMPEQGVNAIYKATNAINSLDSFSFDVPPHPVLGVPTLNVGHISGGLNINSIPDACVFGIDIRTIPKQSHAEVLESLDVHLGQEVELRTLVDVEGLWTSPEDPWVREVIEILTGFLGGCPQPSGASYFTDGSALAQVYSGSPGLVLGPGEPGMAHQTDEYCYVDRVEQAVLIYERIASRWCGV